MRSMGKDGSIYLPSPDGSEARKIVAVDLKLPGRGMDLPPWSGQTESLPYRPAPVERSTVMILD